MLGVYCIDILYDFDITIIGFKWHFYGFIYFTPINISFACIYCDC